MGVPYWSPDEKSIVFTLHRGDDSDIYFMDGNGLHQRKASLAEVPH
jgi:Tol biopolymer transport system component